jgi:hypothetical protein
MKRASPQMMEVNSFFNESETDYPLLGTLLEIRRAIPINKQATLIAHKTPEIPMLNDAFSEPIESLCSKVFC